MGPDEKTASAANGYLSSCQWCSICVGCEATTDENSDVAVKIYGYRGCSRCRTTNLQEQWIEGRGRLGFVRIDRRAVSKKPINNNTTTTTTILQLLLRISIVRGSYIIDPNDGYVKTVGAGVCI